ncbi:hypothetical protein CC1G_15597 [Coprinopsis cinerea okayama7|uniref:Uncharacterized protein n=1 Tax=Coprinopsis cinerea (strain Okayama-7 / 130 / ATCC MYA-4618 / FGSC 9003) TaxID=240176 RepID=D6RNC7_COPC7|nr:hypothetical protein CC1G_15597 [Coprinopsis cinerea okayama7\|eukprot:XP_002911055.1 hypothetical protein CC1G_15597 [Coprinopsis cinerea okayama7\
MSPSHLQDYLPTELVVAITNHLVHTLEQEGLQPIPQLMALAKTCRSLHDISKPIIVERVFVCLRKMQVDGVFKLYQGPEHTRVDLDHSSERRDPEGLLRCAHGFKILYVPSRNSLSKPEESWALCNLLVRLRALTELAVWFPSQRAADSWYRGLAAAFQAAARHPESILRVRGPGTLPGADMLPYKHEVVEVAQCPPTPRCSLGWFPLHLPTQLGWSSRRPSTVEPTHRIISTLQTSDWARPANMQCQ